MANSSESSLLQSPSILFMSPALSASTCTLPLLSPSLLASPSLPPSVQFPCPRCKSFGTRQYNSRHHCIECGMLWNQCVKSIDEEGDEVEEIDGGQVFNDQQSNAFLDVCAECGKPISVSTPSFSCSGNCGRCFHIDCARDPVLNTLICEHCDAELALDANTMPQQAEEASTLINLFADDAFFENAISRSPAYPMYFPKNGMWPSPPQDIRQLLPGFEPLDDSEGDEEIEIEGGLFDELLSPNVASKSTSDSNLPPPLESKNPPKSVKKTKSKVAVEKKVNVKQDIMRSLDQFDQQEYLKQYLLDRYESLLSLKNSYKNLPTRMNSSMQVTASAKTLEFVEKMIKTLFAISKKAESNMMKNAKNPFTVLHAARLMHVPEIILQKNQANLLRTKSLRSQVRAKKEQSEQESMEQPKSVSIPSAPQVRGWGVDQVLEYISSQVSINFPSTVVEVFKENEIDGITILALTYDDLTEDLGIEDEEFVRALLVHISEIHEMV